MAHLEAVLPPLDALLVVGGNHSHDYDLARPELLRLVGRDPGALVDVRPGFPDRETLARTRCLVSYTCDLRPTADEERALWDFVEGGGRWLALHGTNALFDVDPVRVVTGFDTFFGVLGARFREHPPIGEFSVRVSDSPRASALMAGIEPFPTSDEMYLLDLTADVEVLLEAYLDPDAAYVEPVGAEAFARPVPIAYVRVLGAGEVLYLSLGHAGSPTHPHGQHRCSWEAPGFEPVLERAVQWLFSAPPLPG